MLKLNPNQFTETEKSMYDILSEDVKTNSGLRIIDAAEKCNVSPSKVSKFIQKLGFKNFKQFKSYFSGQEDKPVWQDESTEISRLIHYLKHFDSGLVDQFISIINSYEKIIIYGLGPSFFSAEYFGYKLSTVTNKNITVTQFEEYVEQLIDEKTLLLVFSVTGKFTSFENLFNIAHKKKAHSMIVLEEYTSINTDLADYILHLTEHKQSDKLLPFEKTRTIFFIFMEEVIENLRQLKVAKKE